MNKKKVAKIITVFAANAGGHYLYNDIIRHRKQHGKCSTPGQIIWTYTIATMMFVAILWGTINVRFDISEEIDTVHDLKHHKWDEEETVTTEE